MRDYRLLLVIGSIAVFQIAALGQGQKPPAAAPSSAKQAMSPAMSKDDMIKNALSAAPAGIAKDATVMQPGATMSAPMTELKKGTNGWTCLPDDPNTPANDPMCVDKNAMAWIGAWIAHKPPQIGSVGLVYMLQGGSDPDNDDPFATKPKPGKNWVTTPPHIMIFGTKIDAAVYSSAPDTTRPWIMWKGTPYEHLMVPVK